MNLPGFLLTIEGIDGCGKTTLAQALAEQLTQKNYSVLLTKEPGGSELGKKLRSILQIQDIPLGAKAEFLLFAADRAQHFEKVIIPALIEGKIVISDRCADSSLAYQGYGRNLDVSMIKTINNWAMNNMKPDLVFYLKIDLVTAIKRLTTHRSTLSAFEKKTNDFWSKVITGFDATLSQRPEVVTFDATLPPEEVCTNALAPLLEALESKGA